MTRSESPGILPYSWLIAVHSYKKGWFSGEPCQFALKLVSHITPALGGVFPLQYQLSKRLRRKASSNLSSGDCCLLMSLNVLDPRAVNEKAEPEIVSSVELSGCRNCREPPEGGFPTGFTIPDPDEAAGRGLCCGFQVPNPNRRDRYPTAGRSPKQQCTSYRRALYLGLTYSVQSRQPCPARRSAAFSCCRATFLSGRRKTDGRPRALKTSERGEDHQVILMSPF